MKRRLAAILLVFGRPDWNVPAPLREYPFHISFSCGSLKARRQMERPVSLYPLRCFSPFNLLAAREKHSCQWSRTQSKYQAAASCDEGGRINRRGKRWRITSTLSWLRSMCTHTYIYGYTIFRHIFIECGDRFYYSGFNAALELGRLRSWGDSCVNICSGPRRDVCFFLQRSHPKVVHSAALRKPVGKHPGTVFCQ